MLPGSAGLVKGFSSGEIADVVIRSLRRFADDRGWLAEVFRHDELKAEFYPAMCYVSSTEPNVTRGPHEHVDQSDLFCFMGPSNFKLRLWDNRPESETYFNVMTLEVGADNPSIVLIPNRVVHAYRNVGIVAGIVINCPNRLYKGAGRRTEVDEIRYETDGNTIFKMDD